MKHSRVLAIFILAMARVQAVQASTSCSPSPQGTFCTAQVDFSRFAQQAQMSQLQSQWCWAASISMVFAYHGFPVSQARIVTEVYGSPQNIPAQSGIVIARQLNRSWLDDFGERFTAQLTGAYDYDAQVLALTNQQIVGELDQERPLVIGNLSHAMVLTAVQYFLTPNGPNIVSGLVFDPWPGIGSRSLRPEELYPVHVGGSLRFLATVRVTPGESTLGADGDPGSCSVGVLGRRGEANSQLALVLVIIGLAWVRRSRPATQIRGPGRGA